MQVHFTPEQEAQLAQIATKEGTDAEHLVKNAALRRLGSLCTGHNATAIGHSSENYEEEGRQCTRVVAAGEWGVTEQKTPVSTMKDIVMLIPLKTALRLVARVS
jgi:hypothetical protein